MKSKLLAIVASLAALVTASAANAASINIGNVGPGTSGVYVGAFNSSGVYNDTLFGTIPANSKITLSYTLSNFVGVLTGTGTYNGTSGGTSYTGGSLSNSIGVNTSVGISNPVGSGPITTGLSLVQSAANLGANSGTTVITNTSNIAASFTSQLIGFLLAGGVAVSYTVSALSAVPLPAAAYLFGSGLLALAGMSRMKKKQAA